MREKIVIESVGALASLCSGRDGFNDYREREARGEEIPKEAGVFRLDWDESADMDITISGKAEGMAFPNLDSIVIVYANDKDGNLSLKLEDFPQDRTFYVAREGKGAGNVQAIGDADIGVAREGEGLGDAHRSGGPGFAARREEGVGSAYYTGSAGEAIKEGEGIGNAVAIALPGGKVAALNTGEGAGMAMISGAGSRECYAIRSGGLGNAVCSVDLGQAIKEEGHPGQAIHTKGGEAIMRPVAQTLAIVQGHSR